eukprot:g2294.t1
MSLDNILCANSPQKDHAGDLFIQWDSMVKLYLSVFVQAIGPFGYPADATGLQDFSIQLVNLQQTHPRGHELEEITKKTWRSLIKMTFDVDVADGKTLTLSDAQRFSMELSYKLQNQDFLESIRAETDGLSMEDKQIAIAKRIMAAQLEVLDESAAFDFEDEKEGYVKMQLELAK